MPARAVFEAGQKNFFIASAEKIQITSAVRSLQ